MLITMKRLIFVFLAVGVLGLLCFVSIFKKDVLPQPTFPLDEELLSERWKNPGYQEYFPNRKPLLWLKGEECILFAAQ